MAGKAESGKDTASGYVEEYFERTAAQFRHKSFAHALKKSAVKALGIVTDDPDGYCDRLKKHGTVTVQLSDSWSGWSKKISGREYLQNYGTEAHRELFGTDFWVDTALPKDAFHEGEVWVVTDVRFPNEAERIKELGGLVVELERDGTGAGEHASETPLPRELIDATLDNNGSLEDLNRNVRMLVGDILNSRLETRG
jgi:hypothetical protein